MGRKCGYGTSKVFQDFQILIELFGSILHVNKMIGHLHYLFILEFHQPDLV